MRLTRLKVLKASSCGGLLDGLDISLTRQDEGINEHITPICLIGPNGSGKSQFLQLIAEIFQAAWHTHSPAEERTSANDDATFELEYQIKPTPDAEIANVRLTRKAKGNSAGPVELYIEGERGWRQVNKRDAAFGDHLPSLIVGYTSGDNETVSLPFLVSRAGYAASVATAALGEGQASSPPDNRTLLIDYGTNLEVLFANLTLAKPAARKSILRHARVSELSSCRCVVRLAHSAVPRAPRGRKGRRKGIQLTEELEGILDRLKRASTCWHEELRTETYVFDYFVDGATREALGHFFESALDLYRSLHKFALLNDLAIPRVARRRLERAVRERRFASRLPEPTQDDAVFGFEEVRFLASDNSTTSVDYVSLSDGEHQQAMILGLFTMISQGNALFLLDEPESHFNPQWRIGFVKQLLELPVERDGQEVFLTTHAPFVPADMSRDQVLIFSRKDNKVEVTAPEIETYGANFDRILEHCFDVKPPLSQLARDDIEGLLKSTDVDELTNAMERLGSSVEKTFVADRLRQLKQSSE